MAGIGFSLRKLFKDKSCYGYAKAYAWTGMVTTGPFVVMVCLILGVQLLYKYFEVTDYQRTLYIESVVYPFIFSHIIVSGFHMVITRYISDKMYERDLKSVLSSMFGMLSVVLTIGGIIGFLFLLWAQLPFFLELATFLFYMEMMIILLLGSYVSALRNYSFIVKAYSYGVAAALTGTFLVLYLPWFEDTVLWTMLMMDLGALIIAVLLLHNIYMFFGYENYFNYDFIDYFSKFKKLFFINLFYTLGLYGHNIIIWFGPHGLCLADTYYYQPDYDVSTFFAYISILPVMMLFVINTEINFYEKFRRYLMFITEKGNYEEISQSRKEMLQVMWSEIRNIFDIQLVAAFCFIAVGNIVMPMVGLGYSGIDIYNILVLSAFCVGVLQTVMIMLLYLEDRDGALMTAVLLFCLVILFNLISVAFLGEKTYGLGALAANFCTLIFAVCRLNEYSARIDYHIFCSQPVLEVKADGFFSKLHEKIFKKEETLMEKKYKAALLSCFTASAMVLGSGLAYGEESINTFKNVASDAKEIRSQYKDRQSSKYDSQKSMREVEDTISLGNKALADNQKEEGNVRHSLDEINQKQRDTANWFVQNQKLIEKRAPLLNSMTEHADRMQYLDKEIAGCEKMIADRENQVKGYEREMQALLKQAGVYDQTTVQFDSASFNEKILAVHEALDRTKYDEDRLDEADSIKNKLLEGKGGETIIVQGNEQQLAEIDAKLQAVENNAKYVNAQLNGYYKMQEDLYAIRDRVEAEHDLAQEKAELHQMQAEVQNDSETLKNDIKSAEEEKSRLEKYMANEQYGRFFSVGAEFYSWDGDGGDSGHQFYAPVEYFQEYGFHEFGVSFGLVNTSTNFAEAERGLDGITDLSLYYGYRHVFDDKLTLKYTLGVDLPVGESETGDIPVSDDLAPVTRLSEGLNVRPGIEALYWITDENQLKAGLGYTFKGNYDYSKNHPDYYVNPGDGLDGFLYWTHADEYNQWRLGVDSSFLNGKTKENDLFYREGLEMLYKAMYNRKLNDTMDLMGYFWLRQNEGNDYYYPGAEGDGTSYVRYYGLEYKYAPSEKHAWYLRSNNMLSTGTYYDPITGERVNGRKKHVVGAGYEYNPSPETEIGVNLNNFWMKDKSPKKDYDGSEVLVWFNASF